MKSDMLVLKVKQLKGEDGYKTFSVRVREPIVKQIDEISGKTGHSRNELVGLFLEYALKHYRLERGDEDG